MQGNLTALIFVLVCAAPALYLAQLAFSTGAPRDVAIFRNVWIVVTVAAFLSGGFFVYSIIAIAICIFAHASRFASVALFCVLLLAVPTTKVTIGGFDFFNRLIDLNNGRLLAIFLLLPILFKANGQNGRQAGFLLPDRLILGYALVSVVLGSRETSFTHFLRLAVEHVLDMLIPYYAFSRTLTSQADLRRLFLAIVIAALPLAVIGVFESLKYWRLYGIVVVQFGYEIGLGYLTRDGMLRAGVTATSPIVLGLIFMVAIGSAMAIRNSYRSPEFRLFVIAVLVVGLLATLSRGPWVATAAMAVVYLATGPNAGANLTKVAVGAVAVLVIFPLTPYGAKLIDLLPFVGTVEAGTVEFRANLFENSMAIIGRNLWIGSLDYRNEPEMLALHDDFQHMVDIVNHYVKVALDTGIVGLTFFVGFFGSVLLGLKRALNARAIQNTPMKLYARCTLGVLVGVLITIATVSAIDYVPYMMWCCGGLGVAVVRVVNRERVAEAQRFHVRQAAI